MLHLGVALVAAQGDDGGLGSIQLPGHARPHAALFCRSTLENGRYVNFEITDCKVINFCTLVPLGPSVEC